MRARPHMLSMLAAAALAGAAEISSLGAQRMVLPAISLPALSTGGSRAKPGKHRRGGLTSPRGNDTTTWKGRATEARSSARNLRRVGSSEINVHFERRMRWNAEVYPRVLELQAKQRERQGLPHRSGGGWP